MRMILAAIFLSTLSLRRATNSLCLLLLSVIFLSTLSLRRATRPGLTRYYPGRIFYPRSPCGERLDISSEPLYHITFFYPRSPCGERPYQREIYQKSRSFSIHALLAESDGISRVDTLSHQFSIHALLAESDVSFRRNNNARCIFLSTLSLRRATRNRKPCHL